MTTTTGGFRRSAASKRGFTLVEVMIASALGTMLLIGATSSVMFVSKSSAGMGNYVSMNVASRQALEEFGSDVRMATEVSASTSSRLTFKASGMAGAIDSFSYAFDPVAGEVTRTRNGATEVVLADVESFELKYYTHQRAATTVPLEVKEVQIQAVLRRSVLAIDNTNQIISARFMMRNKPVN